MLREAADNTSLMGRTPVASAEVRSGTGLRTARGSKSLASFLHTDCKKSDMPGFCFFEPINPVVSLVKSLDKGERAEAKGDVGDADTRTEGSDR